MNELIKEFQAEKEHILKTLQALKEAMDRKTKNIVELAAIATFLHNAYNGIENLLKRILKFKGKLIPASESWHKDLLDLSVKNNIITLELSKKLDEYLAFRHFFIHGYGVALDKEKLLPLAENLSDLWNEIESELEKRVNSLINDEKRKIR